MKVIDCNPIPDNEDAIHNLSSRLDKILKETPFGRKDAKAYEMMISQMGRVLSDKFYLIRNLSIEGTEQPISSILIGPAGIYVINTSFQKGIFRAKEDSWSEMKGRNRQFEPTHPNLIQDTLQQCMSLGDFLVTHLAQVPVIHPVLILLNPGTHVDSVRPAVRTILMDGFERFITRLSLDAPQITSDDVQTIVIRLTEPPPSPTEIEEEGDQVEKNWRELQALKPVLEIEPKITKNIDSLSNKFSFSTRQWLFLGVIGVVNIILLIIFLIMILQNT
jgi:hypothetical protein